MKIGILKSISLSSLFVLYLIVMHIGIPNFGGPIVIPTTYLVWIVISFFITISVIYILRQSSFSQPWILKYILLFVCLSLITVLFNPILNYHSFFYKTMGLIGGIIFFISLHQFELTSSEKDRLLFVVFISGLIEACYGIIQYFCGPNLILPFVPPIIKGTISGNFQQPNVFSSFMATSIVISLFLITRPLFKNLQAGYRIVFYIFIAVLSYVLFLSNSRAGYIGAAVAALILFISRRRIYKCIPKHALCWLIAVIIGIGTAYAFEEGYFKRTPYIFTKVKDTANESRILIYRASYEMFKDKPLLGHGVGNFGSYYLYYQRDILKKHPEYKKFYQPNYKSHPHNEILYRLTESGLAGGIGMIILVSAFCLIIFRLGRERGGLYFSLLFPLSFHTQVEYPLYQSAAHFMLFMILCYLPSSHFSKKIPVKLHNFLKYALTGLTAAVFILITIFLFKTLNAHLDMVKYNILLEQKGEIRMRLLKGSMGNGYLKQMGTRFYMDAKLRIGLFATNKKLIREFMDWSEDERQITPYLFFYERESRALYALGFKREAFDLLDEGLSLYPDKAELLEIRTVFVAEEIKSRISSSMNKQ